MKIFLITILFTVSLSVFAAVPELQSDSILATAGYYRLSWKGEGEENEATSDFILEEASNPAFSQAITLYSGPDTATLISGRSNGIYYYRIRSNQAPETLDQWSNVVKVEVAHHSLFRAFMFFGLGSIVFATTLVMVIVGNKSSSQ